MKFHGILRRDAVRRKKIRKLVHVVSKPTTAHDDIALQKLVIERREQERKLCPNAG